MEGRTTVRIFAKHRAGGMQMLMLPRQHSLLQSAPLSLLIFKCGSHSKMQILQAVNKIYYLLMLFPCFFSEAVRSSTACDWVTQEIRSSSTAVAAQGGRGDLWREAEVRIGAGVVGARPTELHFLLH